MRLRAVFGNERLFNYDIFAARPLKTGDVPVVFDPVLTRHQEERAKITRPVSADLSRPADRAQHHAPAVIAPSRERPASRNLVSARGLFRFAGRAVRRRMHRRGSVTPHLLLRLLRKKTELPRMHSDHAGDPSCRRRRARELDRRVHELGQRDLAVEQKLPGAIAEPPLPVVVGGIGRKPRSDAPCFKNQTHRECSTTIVVTATIWYVPKKCQQLPGIANSVNKAVNGSEKHKRANGAASRERILDAAAQIASERGYEGSSIALVSLRSGLPASSIYWHFEDKDKLIAAVIERSFNRWLEGMGTWVLPKRGVTRRERFTIALRRTSRMLEEAPDFLRL